MAADFPEDQPKRVRAVRVDSAPVIDGVLDDKVWGQAAVIRDLHQMQPFEYTEPSQRSEFYVIYDKDALYVGAYFWDSEPEKIVARILRQDATTKNDDRISVVLDPFNDKRSGYIFVLNLNNVRRDANFLNPREANADWDGIWQGKSARTADGWTTEVAIPFKSLSFYPENDTWGFNVIRDVIRNRERIAWVSHNRAANPSAAGELYGLTNMDVGKGLDVVPSIAFRSQRNQETSDKDYVIEPSINLFYKITPAFNASLTVNTDFSATEVDTRQVNLTRFSLFFPEKRDFFLKDSDIFEFGKIGGSDSSTLISRVERENARPFFSRKIGLSEDGEPVDLDIGVKLSGRFGQWNIGTLAIRQAEFNNIEPTNIFIGRITRNILDKSTVGVIMTHGDPVSNFDNVLFGADFRYLNTELSGVGTLEAQAWYQQTDSEGVDGYDTAWGLRVRMPNNTGLRVGAAVKEVQENFYPALGFINRTGIRDYIGEVAYTWRPEDSYFQEIFSGIEVRHVELLDDGLQTQKLYFRLLKVKNDQNDYIDLRYIKSKEGLKDPFEISEGVILSPEVYKYGRYGIIVGTGAQRKLSGTFYYYDHDYYSGSRFYLKGSVAWKPSKHFNISSSYTFNDIDLPEGDFITRLITFQSDIVLSDTLSWVNLIQFDNVSRNLGINSRLHWIPEAGRELFFVINHNLLDDVDGFRSIASDVTLSINYTFRF
jgi:hypothetical protein